LESARRISGLAEEGRSTGASRSSRDVLGRGDEHTVIDMIGDGGISHNRLSDTHAGLAEEFLVAREGVPTGDGGVEYLYPPSIGGDDGDTPISEVAHLGKVNPGFLCEIARRVVSGEMVPARMKDWYVSRPDLSADALSVQCVLDVVDGNPSSSQRERLA
jgi:hypothetical protein